MADIFISYASEDRPRAKALAAALESRNSTVWWDRHIPPGKTFDAVIAEHLNSALCVLVLWSRSSVDSDWVKEEAQEGARRRILIPVLLEDVDIPLGFRRYQAAQLTQWRGEVDSPEFQQLLDAIQSLVKPHPLDNDHQIEFADSPSDSKPAFSPKTHVKSRPLTHQEERAPAAEREDRSSSSRFLELGWLGIAVMGIGSAIASFGLSFGLTFVRRAPWEHPEFWVLWIACLAVFGGLFSFVRLFTNNSRIRARYEKWLAAVICGFGASVLNHSRYGPDADYNLRSAGFWESTLYTEWPIWMACFALLFFGIPHLWRYLRSQDRGTSGP